jgi:(2S)-methylsuccinyl-CoA dehydrogenase
MRVAASPPVLAPDALLALCGEAEQAAERYEIQVRQAVRGLIAPEGKVDPRLLECEQFAAHGFAWIATYVAALRQIHQWGEALGARGTFGE